MLIVEGPDGAGKTTLVKRLAETLELPIAERAVGTDTQPLVDMSRWIHQNLSDGLVPKLFDRHRLISEPIYGSILRPEQPLEDFANLSETTQLYHKFAKLRPFIVFCLPPLHEVMFNIRHDHTQPAEVVMNMPRIYRLYFCEAAKRTHSFIYDYTMEQWPMSFDALVKGAEAWMHAKGLRYSAVG